MSQTPVACFSSLAPRLAPQLASFLPQHAGFFPSSPAAFPALPSFFASLCPRSPGAPERLVAGEPAPDAAAWKTESEG